MKFYYVNSKGKRVNFYEYPFIMQSGNLLDYSYSYETSECSKTRLVNVRRGAGERNFKLALLPNIEAGLSYNERRAKLKQCANELFEVFETDVVNNTNGALWTDTGYFLPCRILSSNKDNKGILNGLPFAFETFKAVSDTNAWIKEIKKSFYPQNDIEVVNADADYPYNYTYDYAASASGLAFWNTGHFAPCDFEFMIFGAVVNPTVNINSHSYTVYTSLNENEYLVINSKDNTVIKVTESGLKINVYDFRSKESSVFTKLPPGELTISWNGNFGFDITAFVERSEPEWN